MSLLKKMRGDREGWYKVSDLRPGVEIAVPSEKGQMIWDEIVSIKPVGREQVYDIEVEGTHNFVGNGIFAHNTYVLRANTALAVEGQINAESFAAPAPLASSTLMAEIPSAVLTADGTGVDLYKLATYNLSVADALTARMDATDVRVTSLESRVEALESGAVSTASGTSSFSTSSLASALEGFGAFIQNGLAQFGTLVADRFVAATNSAGTSSAGTVTLLAGNTVAQVSNAYVTSATKVFITFNSPIIGSWYVSDKQSGSFRVLLSETQSTDVSFDYFLVQTEGQVATSTEQQAGAGAPSSSPETAPPASNSSPVITSPVDTSSSTAASSSPETAPAPASSSLGGDTAPPVVTLVGDAAIEIQVGDTFTDPGATAVDDTDGDLTNHINVSGAVDTATGGSYSLTYTATDAAGNAGTASRLVTVLASTSSPQVATEPAPEPAPEPASEPAPTDATTTTTP